MKSKLTKKRPRFKRTMADDEGNGVSSLRVILLGMALVSLGSVGFYALPGMIAEDAQGTQWINAVYCAVITLTTVGFGDICPGEMTTTGRLFIVALSLSGLGMFCGPVMGLASSWKDRIPVGGELALMTFTVTTAVFVFSNLLGEMSQSEAAYFSIVTGTTIGYGDISPKTDAGKLAVALYAILAVNVVASLLQPGMEFLLRFCQVPAKTIIPAKGESPGKTLETKHTQVNTQKEGTKANPQGDLKASEKAQATEGNGKKKKKKKQ